MRERPYILKALSKIRGVSVKAAIEAANLGEMDAFFPLPDDGSRKIWLVFEEDFDKWLTWRKQEARFKKGTSEREAYLSSIRQIKKHSPQCHSDKGIM